MNEVDKILNKLGYVGRDPIKVQEVEDSIAAAEDYMRGAGVPADKITSPLAYTVKSIWADRRDKGTEETLIKRDSFIVELIAQLQRR